MNRNDATTQRERHGSSAGSGNTFWAITSLTVLVILLVANHFRYELFGIEPGYAPHNFGFGVLIILPLSILTLIVSAWTFVWTMMNWNRISGWHRYASAVPSAIVIAHTSYLFGRLLI